MLFFWYYTTFFWFSCVRDRDGSFQFARLFEKKSHVGWYDDLWNTQIIHKILVWQKKRLNVELEALVLQYQFWRLS